MEFRKFLKSFVYAYKGIKVAFKERNFKVHSLFAIFVLLAGYIYKVSNVEFILLIICIGLVLGAEMVNTMIEIICNLLRDKLNLGYEETEIPRDLGAALVLFLAICSAVIGVIIFWERVF